MSTNPLSPPIHSFRSPARTYTGNDTARRWTRQCQRHRWPSSGDCVRVLRSLLEGKLFSPCCRERCAFGVADGGSQKLVSGRHDTAAPAVLQRVGDDPHKLTAVPAVVKVGMNFTSPEGPKGERKKMAKVTMRSECKHQSAYGQFTDTNEAMPYDVPGGMAHIARKCRENAQIQRPSRDYLATAQSASLPARRD